METVSLIAPIPIAKPFHAVPDVFVLMGLPRSQIVLMVLIITVMVILTAMIACVLRLQLVEEEWKYAILQLITMEMALEVAWMERVNYILCAFHGMFLGQVEQAPIAILEA